MWGWIICGLLLVWWFATVRFYSKREIDLESYAIFLLVSEDILLQQRKNFDKWIARANENRADNLRLKAGYAVQAAAHTLGTSGSRLSSSSILWNYMKQLPSKEQRTGD